MKDVVKDYLLAKENLMDFFKCPSEYFVKYMEGYNWQITGEDGLFFLTCWQEGGEKTANMAVSRGDKPLVYYSGRYAMVIAVDCVKTGFILEADRQWRTR